MVFSLIRTARRCKERESQCHFLTGKQMGYEDKN